MLTTRKPIERETSCRLHSSNHNLTLLELHCHRLFTPDLLSCYWQLCHILHMHHGGNYDVESTSNRIILIILQKIYNYRRLPPESDI